MSRNLHRPVYHFLPPCDWMNDPNGLIQWQGVYHLFYQYTPHSADSGLKYWGHAASRDLLHWQHLPLALHPTPGTADEDGCWSGCAVVKDGKPLLIYTGVRGSDQRPCMAVSRDVALIDWEKYPGNPIIQLPPSGYDLTGFRDHSIWFEDGYWYMVIGSGINGVGGATFLHRSPDLLHWEYLNPLLVGNLSREEGLYTGTEWECPDFFQLGGKQFLILSAMEMIEKRWSPFYTMYFAGEYHEQRFYPRQRGKVDYGDATFYAPQSMVDEQGRRLMWGWLMEGRSQADCDAAGWAGVMSLPRQLDLGKDGELVSRPAVELAALRGACTQITPGKLQPGDDNPLPGVHGRALEVFASLALEGETVFSLDLCCSPDGEEFTRLWYDARKQELVLDRSHSSLSTSVDKTPRRLHLACSKPQITLRIFLDYSVLEVNVDEKTYLSSRIYPQGEESDGLHLSVQAGALRIENLVVWQMGNIWG